MVDDVARTSEKLLCFLPRRLPPQNTIQHVIKTLSSSTVHGGGKIIPYTILPRERKLSLSRGETAAVFGSSSHNRGTSHNFLSLVCSLVHSSHLLHRHSVSRWFELGIFQDRDTVHLRSSKLKNNN